MLRASVISVVVLSFMILMLPAHGSQPLHAQQPAAAARPSSIADRTNGMQKLDGYFPLYWDERTGSLFIEIPRFDTEFLLNVGLAAGLGSNDIGLDRGEGGGARIVSFQRVGPRVLLVQPNFSFRSSSANPLERKSVEDSFAKSVLWGFTVAAESDDRVLVDAHRLPPARRDQRRQRAAPRQLPGRSHAQRVLPAAHQGVPEEHRDRDDADLRERCGGRARRRRRGRARPGTGADWDGGGRAGGGGGRGGGLFSGSVASVTPTADAVTLREHVSLVELPDNNYKPRADDPRAGYGGLTFVDYSVPIGEPMQIRYIRRHRLEKKDPTAAVSEPVKPIQYWVDSGAPEDVKKALRRRRGVVEPGVRGRRLPQRVQGGRAARGRRPDGHPLQHDQLGPPLDARLELGRLGDRSAHRRDHQGDGHARLAARSAGLHDLRRPALAVRHRHREAGGAVRNGAQAHPPAVRARGRPHARPRPQLLRQRQGLDLGDGLSPSAREAERRRQHRPVGGVPDAHRRLGQGHHQLRLPAIPARHRTRKRR